MKPRDVSTSIALTMTHSQYQLFRLKSQGMEVRRLYYAEVVVIFSIASFMPLMISGKFSDDLQLREKHAT